MERFEGVDIRRLDALDVRLHAAKTTPLPRHNVTATTSWYLSLITNCSVS